ncbi:hypothetical protein CG826_004485 [Escherichia coli]|uniref:hypothetical protein n=2 Tax=Escherichia coli TaxID=562 RepID=UPI0018240C0E|nr:hypothetical protein [Escherichia coli]EFE5143611.1 hypothetical protein [Escherichia coli]EHR8926129.1 hypothetical protein [Escherichia coli]MDS0569451.1 hypothetical protein [Escherichia coli]MDS0571147.1 hypothetical protein [Escherichia coli]
MTASQRSNWGKSEVLKFHTLKFFAILREIFSIAQMAGAIKPHDIKRVFILYVRRKTITKGSHQTTIRQRRQTRRGLRKING